MTESRATKHVMRNLQTSDVDSGDPWGQVASHFGTTLDSFTRSAKQWLRDKSALSTKTIENADYEVAYLWFIHGKHKGEEMGNVQVRTGKRLWEYFEGTGLFQEGGEEDPEIYAELMALRPYGGGRWGTVSQGTLGWMLDFAESFADVAEDRYDSKAAGDFLSKHSGLYTGQFTAAGQLAGAKASREEESPVEADVPLEPALGIEPGTEGVDHRLDSETPVGSADGKTESKRQVPEESSHGKPIYHVKTGKLVGWWTPKAFVSVESVSEESED
ncbi:hypothetical protein [Streptomyces sp. CBMA123]|uniref:hypothetical protein n=1 Tax=Streptomyces sp. CBMA123 TaxID=1896313 RepID=UPI001661E373|nr:hypothetical protein [Streptomyces sp. CBMA123]MBD0689642.1 hypothetical protein [Streptomyces sp. CBMA123]